LKGIRREGGLSGRSRIKLVQEKEKECVCSTAYFRFHFVMHQTLAFILYPGCGLVGIFRCELEIGIEIFENKNYEISSKYCENNS
jgi:hypothetical protein